jgi:hypothetical protein
MQETVFRHSRIFMLAVIFVLAPAARSEQIVRAEIRRVLATPNAVDDQDVASFTLRFDVRLVNISQQILSLPLDSISDAETARFAILGVEVKQPNGIWKWVMRSGWIEAGNIKFQPCKPLRPGETAEIANLSSGFITLKENLAGLGSEPSVRLHLIFACRQQDGRVLMPSVTTEPFNLRLSDKL